MTNSQDSVVEVLGLSKLYAREQAATKRRLAKIYFSSLVGRVAAKNDDLMQSEFWSLRDVSFSLRRGEALGVIGLNGAGKTTLLRILAGQVLPDRGEVRLAGKVAAMIDLTAGFQMGATGRRNIYLRGAMLGRSRVEIDASRDEIISFSELGDAIDAPVATYSSGMLMRLAFSIMVASKPDVMFIDEILSVGDFLFRQKCLSRIRELRDQAAVVLVSHSMASIKLFCDRALLLQKGRVAFEGAPVDAIEMYESIDSGAIASTSDKSKRDEILKPQLCNHRLIADLKHYWCDADGNQVESVPQNSSVFFVAEFRLNYTPKNLIIGIPIWSEDGIYVTGLSTPRSGGLKKIDEGACTRIVAKIPCVPFNPKTYYSNIVINDGPEFIARVANPDLQVISSGGDCWGLINTEHNWLIN
jgi:ABC-type polysaccharide/polyol phosphate transport system ATPase subunit